jgi:hypothetical protein
MHDIMFPVKKDARSNPKVKIEGGLPYRDDHKTWVFLVVQTFSGNEE